MEVFLQTPLGAFLFWLAVGIAAGLVFLFVVYITSAIQMRAWLNEIIKYIKELDLEENE